MDNDEAKQSILERFISDHPDLYEATKARHRNKIGKSALLHKELLTSYQPLVDEGIVRHRVNKSNSYRVHGEYIQIAYRISIRASDGKWQRIDVGKESIKRRVRELRAPHADRRAPRQAACVCRCAQGAGGGFGVFGAGSDVDLGPAMTT